MSDLLPCPFCGQMSKLWNDNKVSCSNPGCGCYRSILHDNATPFYVRDWNTRADIVSEREKKLMDEIEELRSRLSALTYVPPAHYAISFDESNGPICLEMSGNGGGSEEIKKHADTIRECE